MGEICICANYKLLYGLQQESPTPDLWPIRIQATEQEVSNGWGREAWWVFRATSHHSHCHLISTSCQISSSIGLEAKSTVIVTSLTHPQTILPTPGSWKNCLPWNWSLCHKGWGLLLQSELTPLHSLIREENFASEPDCILFYWLQWHTGRRTFVCRVTLNP